MIRETPVISVVSDGGKLHSIMKAINRNGPGSESDVSNNKDNVGV